MTTARQIARQDARQWLEHQSSYRKYGLEMKPPTEKRERAPSDSSVTAKDKARLLFLLLFAGALCVSVIIAAAYTAKVKYETNVIIEANVELRGEIENLHVKVKQATNIKTIEVKAREELGMVNPTPDEFIFVAPEQQPMGDFAMVLMEQAYYSAEL